MTAPRGGAGFDRPPFLARSLDRRAALSGALLTFPALAALAATILYPIAWTLWISLNGKNFALTGVPAFVGLKHSHSDQRGLIDALLHTLGFVLRSGPRSGDCTSGGPALTGLHGTRSSRP
jgi:ABC-type sugar transport system permease subunit